MNLPLISQLPADIATGLLVVLLVVVFVVAFRIMKMVFETIAVSALSAVFYVALSFVMNYSFSFNQMLSYAFLGATLYMAYSFLASAYGIARTALEIPYRILLLIYKPLKHGFEHIEERYRLHKVRKDKKKASSADDEDEGGSSTKEVIIDKVKDE